MNKLTVINEIKCMMKTALCSSKIITCLHCLQNIIFISALIFTAIKALCIFKILKDK